MKRIDILEIQLKRVCRLIETYYDREEPLAVARLIFMAGSLCMQIKREISAQAYRYTRNSG